MNEESAGSRAASISRDWTRSFADRLESVRLLLRCDEEIWDYMTARGDLAVLDAAVRADRVRDVRRHVIESLRASHLPFGR